jgi:hypothetical protein
MSAGEHETKEESVEELMEKLAQKGKKVKLVDDNKPIGDDIDERDVEDFVDDEN